MIKYFQCLFIFLIVSGCKSLTVLPSKRPVKSIKVKRLIENLEKLSKNLEISKESSVKCQESLKNLRTETLRKKSYEISQKQVEESVNVDDLIQSVMSIPPEPKLIDF